MTWNPFDLTGKVAVITGGNRGIGLGMAEALAKAGASLSIWGTNEETNQQALELLSQQGPKVISKVCDVRDEKQVKRAMDESVEELGRLDGCFANAGVGGSNKPFHEITAENWKRTTSINLDGCFYTLREAARKMLERCEQGEPGGRLIATSSLTAKLAAPQHEDYGATKSAVTAMMRSLAVEYAAKGITANSILPGWIETDMNDAIMKDKRQYESIKRIRIPARRWGTPEDLGGIAIYLMSDVSGYHTGDSFVIDGGYSVF